MLTSEPGTSTREWMASAGSAKLPAIKDKTNLDSTKAGYSLGELVEVAHFFCGDARKAVGHLAFAHSMGQVSNDGGTVGLQVLVGQINNAVVRQVSPNYTDSWSSNKITTALIRIYFSPWCPDLFHRWLLRNRASLVRGWLFPAFLLNIWSLHVQANFMSSKWAEQEIHGS